jgi:hypothetical protein
MTSVSILVDVSNIYHGVMKKWGTGAKLDYSALISFCSEWGTIVNKTIYAARIDANMGFINGLQARGWVARTRLPKRRDDGTIRCDLDVDIAVDIVTSTSDLVIVCSADGDLAPAVMKRKCYVIGCNISRDLCRCAKAVFEIPPSLLEAKDHVLRT